MQPFHQLAARPPSVRRRSKSSREWRPPRTSTDFHQPVQQKWIRKWSCDPENVPPPHIQHNLNALLCYFPAPPKSRFSSPNVLLTSHQGTALLPKPLGGKIFSVFRNQIKPSEKLA